MKYGIYRQAERFQVFVEYPKFEKALKAEKPF